MTLVYLILNLRYFLKEELTIVVMGATGKAEERIFCTTNYFAELTNFYPTARFTLYFAGLELSKERNGQTHRVNERLTGHFHRGSVQDFLDKGLDLPLESTIFIGYNPGFGSGYDLLLYSWAVDLATLLNKGGYPVVFT
jgi:hypothetical protein